jgi:hypothetical protein
MLDQDKYWLGHLKAIDASSTRGLYLHLTVLTF